MELCIPRSAMSAVTVLTFGFTLSLAPRPAKAQNLVNIDATLYGYTYTGSVVTVGQQITPISLAPGGALNQLTLSAGTYTVTNAAGQSGANPDFTGWRYNSNPNWIWSVLIADDATDEVVFYTDAGGIQSSQAAIAAQPDVINVTGTFTLPTTATLDFLTADYYLPDNAGGVAVNVQKQVSPVPEPGSVALLVGLGVGGAGFLMRRRRQARQAA